MPPGLPANPTAILDGLANFAARSDPFLSSHLKKGQAEMADGALRITLPPGALARSFASPEKEALLAQMAGDLWGAELKVKLGLSREEEVEKPKPRKRDVTALANHQAVMDALEVFEAEVVALNPEEIED